MSTVNQDPHFEPFEVVGEAEHSAQLSVIVEGVNDAIWFQKLEDGILRNVAFKQVGGKDLVLKCYLEAKHRSSNKMVFVADKDLWAIFGVPDGYEDLILTEGYSIENDLLKDSAIHKLFTSEEKRRIQQYRILLSRWFAFYAYKYHAKIDSKHKWPNVNYIVKEGVNDDVPYVEFNPEALARFSYEEPNDEVVSTIMKSFELVFRGKSLLQMYERILRNRKKNPPSYNGMQIMDMAINFEDNPLQKAIVAKLRAGFRKLGHEV